jgi:outer membrane immunogenic protein
MRSKIVSLLTVTLSLGFAQAASAADMPMKAAPMVAPVAAFSWTGFYVGLNGGYGWGTNSVSFSPSTPAAVVYFTGGAVPSSVGARARGGLFGAQVGYNWQWTPTWLVGLEADIDWASISGNGSVATTGIIGFDPFTTFVEQKVTSLGTVRGRIGYTADRVLFYGTGGLAYGRTELNTSITDVNGGRLCGPAGLCAAASSTQWRAGWTAGGGIEWAFASPWSAKVEYLHYDLGSRSQNQNDPVSPLIVFTSSATFRGDLVRAGINYKLN